MMCGLAFKYRGVSLEVIDEKSAAHERIVAQLPGRAAGSSETRKIANAGDHCLTENVLHFVKDAGVAVGRFVFHFHRAAELLQQFALFAA